MRHLKMKTTMDDSLNANLASRGNIWITYQGQRRGEGTGRRQQEEEDCEEEEEEEEYQYQEDEEYK